MELDSVGWVRRRPKILAANVIAIMLVVGLAACGGDGGSTAAKEEGTAASTEEVSGGGEGKKIGVAMKTQLQPRWGFDVEAMEEQAAENGDELIVQYANDDPEEQASQVENLLSQQIDALILVPVDDVAAAALVSNAKGQGVPVVSYDIAVQNAPVDYFVTRNNVEVGELQAEAALEFASSGNFAVIKGDAANSVARDIGGAVEEALEAASGANIVFNQYTKNWDPETALSDAENVLSRNNDDVQAFVTSNDGMAGGVVQALKGRNLQGKVFVSGLDADPANLKLIAEGDQTMTVWTKIDDQGRTAEQAAHELANGETPAADAELDSGSGESVPAKFVPVLPVNEENLCEFVTEIAPSGWVSVDEVFSGGSNPCT